MSSSNPIHHTPLISNAAREADSITLNGTRFDLHKEQEWNVLGPVSAPHHLGLIPASLPVSRLLLTMLIPAMWICLKARGERKNLTSSVTFRVLPKIVSTTPVNARAGKAKQLRLPAITCQDANCADYATDSDDDFQRCFRKGVIHCCFRYQFHCLFPPPPTAI